MQIQLQETDTHGEFFIESEGENLAEMTFSKAQDLMIIDHTEVSEKLGGKGIGKQLVHYAVEYARNQHMKILPLCPFAKKIMEASKEYADVLR